MKRHIPSCLFESEDDTIPSFHDELSCETLEAGDAVLLLRANLIHMMRKQKWQILMDKISFNDSVTDVALSSKEDPVTLLHIACTMLNIPVCVIRAIIKLNPGAVLMEDEDGSLPIHLACAVGLSLEVIEELMIECPKSCLQMDHQDEFPLYHMLMDKQVSTKVEPLVGTLILRLPPSCIYNESTSLLHEMRDGIFHEGIIHQVIQLHPEICHIRNKNGDTLLHVLCYHSKSTARTIRRVIDCNSQACATPDNDGNLPLHLVNSDINSEEIIQMLLNAHAQAIFARNANGNTPLFMRSITNSHKKIKAILRFSDRTAIRRLLRTTNDLGLVPAQDFFYRIQSDLTDFITCNHQYISSLAFNSKYNQELKDQITSLFLLTRAYAYGSIDKVDINMRLQVPHQSFFWTSLPLFIKVLMQHSPHLAMERDCNGDLPLHIIANDTFNRSSICQCIMCGDVQCIRPFQQNIEGNQVCTKCHCPGEPSLVKFQHQKHAAIIDVLKAYPQAASIPDCCGNLPLHLSLQSGKLWDTGVKEIFEAAPHAIQIQDIGSNLPPFAIAASKTNVDDLCYPAMQGLGTQQVQKDAHLDENVSLMELTTAFELLRRDPCQVMVLQDLANDHHCR